MATYNMEYLGVKGGQKINEQVGRKRKVIQ